MLEKNKDTFRICIKFRIKLRIPILDFRHIFLMREEFRIKITISYFFCPETRSCNSAKLEFTYKHKRRISEKYRVGSIVFIG